MDRIFHAFSMPQIPWMTAGTSDGALGLRVDIDETDSEIEVKADLPGTPEKDVEVTLEDDVLRIRAEKSRNPRKRRRPGMSSNALAACSSGRSAAPPELTLRT